MPFQIVDGPRDGLLEGTDSWNVGLAVNQKRTNIVRAEFSAWSVAVVDIESGSEIYTRSEASNADIPGIFLFFDTLQTDDYWGKNAKGYNFRHNVRATDLTGSSALKAGRSYLFTYSFTTADYGTLKLRFRWKMAPR